MEDEPQPPGEWVEITASPDDAGGRADKALSRALPDWSRQRLKVLFDEGKVSLNDSPTAGKVKVAEGDVLKVFLPEPPSTKVTPIEFPLEVLFEDEHLVAINKPAGIVTHPGAAVQPPTLCHALLHHTGGKLAQAGGEDRPGVVHRLDKPTTGVIVFAKTDEAYYNLVKAFAERATKKEYFAIVAGSPELEAGSVLEPIERDPFYRTRMAVREDGRPAHTDWQVVERLSHHHCLVHCRIHTGRTHQIRVHMGHLGMPLLGDKIYGYQPRAGERKVTDIYLHAARLELPHPETGEALVIETARPATFESQLEALRQA